MRSGDFFAAGGPIRHLRLDYFVYYRLARHWRLRVAAVRALQAVGRRFLVLRADLTNTCNLRCRMCYLAGRRERPLHLSREQIDRLAAQIFPSARNVYLSCGFEPLMAENFFHGLERVRAFGVPFSSIVTNGQLLDREKIIRLMELALTEIIVSVDSPRAPTYDSIRGGGFSRLMTNLELLAELKQERGSRLPELRFNVTLMRDNIAELPELVKLAGRLGARCIHLRHMDYFPEATHDFFDQTLLRMPEKTNAILAAARRLAGASGIFLDAPPPLPAAGLWGSESASAGGRCPYPWFQVVARIDGDLAPCSYWRGPGLGNVFRENFREIWSEGFGRVRREMWRGGVPEGCRQCSINGSAKDHSRLWPRLAEQMN